jgi:signal transduction histidine kinase
VLWALSLTLVVATGVLAVTVGPLSASAGLVPAAFSASFATVGAVAESCRPRHPVGRLYLLMGLLAGVQGVGDQYVAATPRLPGAALLGWVSSWIWLAWGVIGLTLLLLTFPSGRLLRPRWRLVGWLAVAGALAAAVGFALTPGPLPNYAGVANPFGVAGAQPALDALVGMGNLLYGVALVAAAGSVVVRFRRSRGDERQQLKWFAYASTLAAAGISAAAGYEVVLHRSVGWPLAAAIVVGIAGIGAATAVAIVSYRLYDIDLLINRTLVYAAVTTVLLLVYLGLSAAATALLGGRGRLGVALLGAAVVAVLFAPLRDHAQRRINRLLYGQRDEPYTVVAELGRRLEATLTPEDVLPTIVDTVAAALRLSDVVVTLDHGGTAVPVASRGRPGSGTEAFALTYQGARVGELRCGRGGEALTTADRVVLEALARQAGVAAHAVRLTAELQRSRERLVTSVEEERRRLRRELHDALGPQLAGLTLGIETARQRLADDPQTDALLAELGRQAEDAVSDVRRLAHGLRPPALDELGLAAALRQLAQRTTRAAGIDVQVHVPDALPPLPAAVEVAAYRITAEALTNAVQHAAAHTCDLTVSVDPGTNAVLVEVCDDGRGLAPDRPAGVGLGSMRERAAELGGRCDVDAMPQGGTRVRATLPHRPAVEPPDHPRRRRTRGAELPAGRP